MRGVEIAIRGNRRTRQISQVSRGVEEVSRWLKTSFSRKENTDMNAIKHATQPMT